MSYATKYRGQFKNRQQQTVTVDIQLKDYAGDVEAFVTKALEVSDSSDEDTIMARECTLTIRANDASTITWETFLAGAFDEWKLIVDIDGQKHFEGFLTPEEGNSPFLDKPYNVKLKASNGLKLLKDVPLTDLNGNTYKGKFTLLDYLVSCLSKTLLQLPIRIYGSIYNEDMDDRGDDIAATYWNQCKEDHRSWQNGATTFQSCYDVLVAMLSKHSRLFYWNGKWTIFYMPEHQYTPGGLFYTDFSADGTLIGGEEDTEGYATVGKAQLIYPVTADQLVSSSFPIKYSKTQYNYKIWPELPLNNKFERGTILGTGTDADGNPYTDYSIDDWTSGTYQGNPTEFTNLPATTVGNPDPWYRRSTKNAFGVEIKREVIIERATAAGGRYIQSEGIPVNAGDKMRYSLDWRASVDLSDSDPVPVQMTSYIVEDGTGDKYVLRSKDGIYSEAKWELAGSQMIGIYTTPNADLINPQSLSVESPAFPVNGTHYVMLWSSVQLGDNTYTAYKGFSMEYLPYVAGSFVPISGDYWQHIQDANQIDKDENEIKISDTIIRVLQGCLFNADGVTATTPTWYRYGLTESRDFKELVDIGRFNLGYRRFWTIEGTFKRLQYSPVNDELNHQPIGYHKTYRFSDLAVPRDFIITTPLQMDLVSCKCKVTFLEVYKDSNDGTQEGDDQLFSYIFSNT